MDSEEGSSKKLGNVFRRYLSYLLPPHQLYSTHRSISQWAKTWQKFQFQKYVWGQRLKSMFFEKIFFTLGPLRTCMALGDPLLKKQCIVLPKWSFFYVLAHCASLRFFWLHLIWRGKPQKNCFHLHQLITPDQIVNALNTLNVIEI